MAPGASWNWIPRLPRAIARLALLSLGAIPCLTALPAAGQPSEAQGFQRARPLTAASDRDALAVTVDFLRSRRAARGAAPGDLDELRVTDRYTTKRNGTVHLYLRQQIGGIEVRGANVGAAVDARGRLLSLSDRTLQGLRARPRARSVRLDAEAAILAAAGHLGLEPSGAPSLRSAEPGPARASVHEPAGLSRDEIPAKLEYVVEDSGALRLAWNLVIRTPDGSHWWSLHVAADDGSLLARADWIARDGYRVFPLPLASPDEGPRALLVDPADATASPFGWHDTDGAAGAEHTDTRGNNVFAQEDIDADDAGGQRPDGGAGLVFDSPLDLSMQPGNHIDAAVTQLFYVNNAVHDILYHYGFDEAAGNFQQNNYGNGGMGGDPVQADAQDGSDTNNAQFGTPPDGSEPRMEMFLWDRPPSPRFEVTAPPAIAGTYLAGGAAFGAGSAGLAGAVVQALDPADGAGPATTDACSPLTNAGAVAGNLALIDRGICTFVVKVGHAQDAGAIGVVIANNAGNGIVQMAGIDPTLTIPAVFIGQDDGAAIAAQLGAGVAGELTSLEDRGSSLDTGVVVHEYVHGLTNRLSGGPSTVSCMDAAESAGMGEGFSDWFALAFTALPTDQGTDPRGIGPYLLGEAPTGAGIRNAPYSTDLGTSPFTYADVSTLNAPHGVGEVWASALWEMYWNFVDAYGFDADLHGGSGGNNRALQLVVDALKLQPCDPTMVEGRDALLTAEFNESAGLDECLVWNAFARRGLGVAAADGGGPGTLSVTEDFDVPEQCLPEPASLTMLSSGALLLHALARRRRGAA